MSSEQVERLLEKIVPLRRTFGDIGEIYGFRCLECEAWWKVYQNEYHKEGCEQGVDDG